MWFYRKCDTLLFSLSAVTCCCHRHEHASGYYRVSTYFIAKVFMDLIPLRLIPVPVYCTIAYWMVGMYVYML